MLEKSSFEGGVTAFSAVLRVTPPGIFFCADPRRTPTIAKTKRYQLGISIVMPCAVEIDMNVAGQGRSKTGKAQTPGINILGQQIDAGVE